MRRVFGDMFNVAGQIKVIDRNLDLRYDGNGKYTITHNGKYFMRVPHDELDQRTVNHVRRMVYMNRHNLLEKDLLEKEMKQEIAEEKRIADLAQCMAEDIRRPLIDKVDYGR
jgi:hypothetical protein